MSYEVTATRKRPQSFDQLAGQEFVSATLESSIASGRIAHAYLFSGPRGCGKTSTARILAKALNCENGPSAHPCGTCDSCRSITAGSSLDVIEIDGASNTSVDNVRQIKDEVLFPPNGGRYKIYIIDEVHMLSTSAFNALLKTIEEPPPYIVFMFATTELYKVPATIKSRCQQFAFRLVPVETIKGLLADAAREAQVEAEPDALLWIARESGGSVRDAYTLFDQVLSFSGGRITAELIRDKLGLVGQDRMNALFGRFAAGDPAGALAMLDEILARGVSGEQFLGDSAEYCRALMLLKHGIAQEGLLGAPLSSFDPAVSDALSEERIEHALGLILDTYRNLRYSVEPRFELELLVARLARIQSQVSPSEVARAVSMLRRAVERGASSSPSASVPRAAPAASAERVAPAEPAAPDAPAAAVPAAAVPAAAARIDDPAALRKAVINEIRRVNVMIATSLSQSAPWRIEHDRLLIGVRTAMEVILLKQNIGLVAEKAALCARHPLRIEFAQEQASAQAPAQGAAPAPAAAREPEQPAARLPSPDPVREPAAAPRTAAVPTQAGAPPQPRGDAPPAALDPDDEARVSMVERMFKGARVSVSATPALSPESGGASSGSTGTADTTSSDNGVADDGGEEGGYDEAPYEIEEPRD